jgi:transposase
MFLRRNRKKINGVDYECWTLVESIRTAKGPRQRVVATIGKLPGLDKEERIGWERIQEIIDGKERLRGSFFEKEPQVPDWATVELRNVSIERMRQFGDVYLGLLLWKKLELGEIFEKIEEGGKEEIRWSIMYCILTIARFCNPSSELHISESWYEKTALEDFLGASVEQINEARLYRTLDHIIAHKDEVSRHLQERYRDLFGTEFEFLIYDVTSTYFEGQSKNNPQAKRGYSRDHRSDCVQVCIGLVVTMEGLPVGYEVFDGNRHDVTTLEDMVKLMEGKYGKAKRIWVFDRGIVTEENIGYITERGAQYIVGTPRSMLKKFEIELSQKDYKEVEPEIEVKVVKHPDYRNEKFIICRSRARAEKDKAIVERQEKKLREELDKIRRSIQEKKLRDGGIAERRIGRWMGKYERGGQLFEVRLVYDKKELKDLEIRDKRERRQWVEKAYGSYLLRTNITEEDPCRLWKMYMQLNQAENAFRMSKSNLGLRPIFHQKEHRVQAHIFICFLALGMLKSLELWMDGCGLGRSPKKLIEEIRQVRSMDVVLPVKNRGFIRLRVVSKPEEHIRVLLYKMGIKLPNRAKIIQNVVEKIGG